MLSPTHDSARAFERVYRDGFEFVWRALRAFGVDDDTLDDAVQDVFIVVHRRLPEFEGRAAINTWLYEIARRVGMRYRTRAYRDATRHSELRELRSKDDLEGTLDEAIASSVLRDFLAKLDHDRRRAFVLAEFFEMPGREIAETLDVNINTIYARLRSARTELDRLARRIHAQDAGALTRAIRIRTPRAETKRRVFAGVLASLGAPVATTATAGLGSGLLVWAIAGLAVGGVVIAVASGSVEPPSPPPVTTERAPVTSIDRVVAPRPPKPSTTAAVQTTVSPPPTSPPAPRPARSDKREALAVPTSLREQLARVRSVRRAVREGDTDVARAEIAAYRRADGRGALAIEVDALEVELACRTQQIGAHAQFQALKRTYPSDPVIARLEKICEPKIAPQKPRSVRTQPP